MEKGKEIIQPRAEKMNNNQKDKEIQCITIPAAAVPSFGGFQVGDLCFKADGNGFAFGRIFNSPETMPKEANTYLYVDNGQVRLANYKDTTAPSRYILPVKPLCTFYRPRPSPARARF